MTPADKADTPRADGEPELVGLLHSIDVPAPERLHERVQAMVDERSRTAGLAGGHETLRGALYSMRLRLGALAAAGAALGAALALALGGPGGAGLSLGEAAALTLRPATMAAPTESHALQGQLNASVDGISFPYWKDRFGWRSSGSREDRAAGRRVRTVFYTDGHGRRIGYAIVSGTPAPNVSSGSVSWRGATAYYIGKVGETTVVTWQRGRHLCIVSGHGVDAQTLVTLASWDDAGD
ncbi:MAG TPA: hypothetical protein VNV44_01370 [Solirubrobacteraceae bacterium]|jgi:hypothetical protein|nr:hypothetical protein [Solirubrobacteraceae bacterium]